MDKWTELKDWVTKGIKNLDELKYEAMSDCEWDRLSTRKNEFNNLKIK